MTDDHEFRASERRRQRAIDSTENERRAHRNAQRSRQRALHRRRRLTALGVDEIQFDYIRFPTYAGGVWPHKRNEPKSVTINAFLDRARAAFKPAKLAVSVFGVAAVHPLDGAAIGQVIPQMMKHVDVISPMIYPRLYNPGEFDLPVPRSEPGTVVARTLGYYKSDLLGSSVKLRPWLQDYDGYGYDQVAAQVHAADRAGVDGWLLWDAGVDYQTRALNIDR